MADVPIHYGYTTRRASNPASVYDLQTVEQGGATSELTKANYPNLGTGSRLFTPETTQSGAQSPPVANNPARNQGWRSYDPIVSGALVRFNAENAVVLVRLKHDQAAGIATADLTCVLYAIDYAGTSQELGRATLSTQSITSAITGYTFTIPVSALTSASERTKIQIEVYVNVTVGLAAVNGYNIILRNGGTGTNTHTTDLGTYTLLHRRILQGALGSTPDYAGIKHGTVSGAPAALSFRSATDADFGQGFDFDGVDRDANTQGVRLTNASDFVRIGTQALTAEALCRADTFVPAGNSRVLLGVWDSADGANWLLYIDGSEQLVFAAMDGDGTTVVAVSSAAVPIDADFHAEGTYDGANLRVFIDGVLRATTAFTGFREPNYGKVECWIGRNADLAAGANKPHPWDGPIYWARISDIARHTANFTPPSAPPADDANTLGAWNLESITSPTGALVKQIQKPLNGSITPAGSLVKSLQRLLVASMTPTGSLRKQTQRKLIGSVTPGPGVLTRRTNKLLAANLTPSGSVRFSTSRLLTGSLTPQGNLFKLVVLGAPFTGSVSPTGTLYKRVDKPLGGTITPGPGLLSSLLTKNLGGAITPTGSLTKALARALAGIITPTGRVLKQVSKFFSAEMGPTDCPDCPPGEAPDMVFDTDGNVYQKVSDPDLFEAV